MANCMSEAMERYEEAITRRVTQDRQRDYVPLSTSMGDELERANREIARIARRTRQSPEHYVEDMTVTQEEENNGRED